MQKKTPWISKEGFGKRELEFILKYAQLQEKWSELEQLSGDSGAIAANIKNFGTVIQTGSGLLLLKEVQLAGKKAQSGWDFVNGMRLSIGEKLGDT